MTDLSVIIITRDRLAKLKRCLESVRNIMTGAEVIVVDNGSSDGTEAYLAHLPGIIGVRLHENSGVAKARNIGAAKAVGEFLMFLDDDAWIGSLDFEEIKKYFAQHPEVALIAPRILYPDGRVQESVRTFPTWPALFWRGSGLYKLLPNVRFYRRYVSFESTILHEADWVIGACQIIRRSAFIKSGKLDERYFFGYEDAEFCRRLKHDGWRIMYWPEAVIYHEYARTSSKALNRRLFDHICSIGRFFRSND